MQDFSIEKEIRIFLHNLVWLKQHYGYTKQEMAEILDISEELWEEVEKIKIPTRLTGEVFYRIKEHFDITPSDMLYKEFE